MVNVYEYFLYPHVNGTGTTSIIVSVLVDTRTSYTII